MAVVSAELDEETKRKAEAVLQPMGVSSASAIRMMFARIAEDGVLPFESPETREHRLIADLHAAVKALLDKIEALPRERQIEVEDFVDFVQQREELRALRHDFTEASEPPFAEVWDNPRDAIYDAI